MSEEEILSQRIEKISTLKNMGINAFPNRYQVTITAAEVLKNIPDGTHALAGRIMTMRKMGKACFLTMKDSTAKIQLYVKQDIIGEENYKVFSLLDIGDFIGVEGTVFKTKTGETTIRVEKFALLSKAIRSLPEKWHGLKDVETRYRQRYLDLISNDDISAVFKKRAAIITAMRNYLDKNAYVEVETPIMQSIPGGAMAKPFVTHHNALNIDLYLRIAPELYLKRLIVGGLDKVYEIGRTFRNEGISIRHNPEFTILEAYQAYSDYNDMMNLCKNLIIEGAKAAGSAKIKISEKEVDLLQEWKKISIIDSFKAAGVDTSLVFDSEKITMLRNCEHMKNVENREKMPSRKIFDHLFDAIIKPNLLEPTFVVDFPKFVSPLAKSKPDNPEIVERFELYINGEELANAYTELNDPIEQKKRFEMQAKEREKGDDEAEHMDDDFIKALEYGMPPTGGLGIGIDRLVILLTGQSSIKDVILFPLLKVKNEI